MHRAIAKSGKYPEHFAYKDKEFYGSCSLTEYYYKFAKTKLRYDKYFKSLLEIIPKERIIVVSQERMAENLVTIAEFIKGNSDKDRLIEPAREQKNNRPGYVSFADKSKVNIDEKISEELSLFHNELYKAIRNSGVRYCI